MRRMKTPSLFGRNLARVRARMGLSQEEVGHRSGTGQGFISQLENGGIQEPGVEKARRIEAALGLRPYALLRPERRVPKAS